MGLSNIWMLLAISPVWGCPEPWYTEGPHCYMYMSNPTDWTTASENCINEGGHLVSIGDDQEQSFLTSFRDSQGVVENPVWLGLKGDTNQEWIWADNTPLLWSEIQFLDPPLTDNCLSLTGQLGMHSWDPIPCVMPLDSICEFDGAEDTGVIAGHWHRIGKDKKNRLGPVLEEVVAPSRIRCASSCAVAASCLSFSFEPFNTSCVLLSASLVPSDLVPGIGWETWTK
ncbi:type-2 ice-structuring protein-like [Haliotis asinina]|uniref:type-2 ice-structuring protein-like n=1 Tax=Haliotis asinina TaxID=109174 RepID=UPI003532594A